jgi:hypothetical protein
VRTPVVDGINLPVMVDDGNRVPAPGNHPAPSGFKLVYGSSPYLPFEHRGHNVSLHALNKNALYSE